MCYSLNGTWVLRASSWLHHCAWLRRLQLHWWLVSPKICDQLQSPSGRLTECPWISSYGHLQSERPLAVLHRRWACEGARDMHDQPNRVVRYQALWRCYTSLSAQRSLRLKYPAMAVEVETVQLLCVPLVNDSGSHLHTAEGEDYGAVDLQFGW